MSKLRELQQAAQQAVRDQERAYGMSRAEGGVRLLESARLAAQAAQIQMADVLHQAEHLKSVIRRYKLQPQTRERDRLIEDAKRIGGHHTKKAAVTAALEEYVLRRRQLAILDLAGKVDYDPEYDYKRLRRRRPR